MIRLLGKPSVEPTLDPLGSCWQSGSIACRAGMAMAGKAATSSTVKSVSAGARVIRSLLTLMISDSVADCWKGTSTVSSQTHRSASQGDLTFFIGVMPHTRSPRFNCLISIPVSKTLP